MRTGYVDCAKVKPYVKELVLRCGTWEAAADYIGVTRMTVYRILHLKVCEVRKSTAALILTSLERKRREDRKRNGVNKRFTQARMLQARIEDNLERMAGY